MSKKYLGIDNINKPAFDAIPSKSVEAIEGTQEGTIASVLGLDSDGKLVKGNVSGGTKLYKHTITINTDNKLIIHSTRQQEYTSLVGEGSVGEDLVNGYCYFVSGTYNSGSSQLISGLISAFTNTFYFDLYEWEHSSRLTPIYASNSIFVSDTVTEL